MAVGWFQIWTFPLLLVTLSVEPLDMLTPRDQVAQLEQHAQFSAWTANTFAPVTRSAAGMATQGAGCPLVYWTPAKVTEPEIVMGIPLTQTKASSSAPTQMLAPEMEHWPNTLGAKLQSMTKSGQQKTVTGFITGRFDLVLNRFKSSLRSMNDKTLPCPQTGSNK